MKNLKIMAVSILCWVCSFTVVSADDPSGQWQAQDGATLSIDGDRFALHGEEKLQVFGILDQDGENLYLVLQGCVPSQVRTQVNEAEHGVRLQVTGAPLLEERGSFQRTSAIADSATVQEAKVGRSVPLTEKEKQRIAAELVEMFEHEQALLKSGESGKVLESLRQEILDHLKALIEEIGWVDIQRFGQEVSYKAAVLLKHVGDVGLRSAVLPHIEEDFGTPGPDSMAFAIVYDSIQLDLGRPQKFGTQIGRDSDGNPVVCLLEDVSRLEEYRSSLGLPSFEAYLDLASRELFQGQEIRVLGDEAGVIEDFQRKN